MKQLTQTYPNSISEAEARMLFFKYYAYEMSQVNKTVTIKNFLVENDGKFRTITASLTIK